MIAYRLRLRLRKLKNLYIITSVLTLILILTFFPNLSYAQVPGEIPVEETKPVIRTEIKDNLLTVDLMSADFGTVMKELSEKVNFKLEISDDVARKKISTKFSDIDVERGIRRLLTLIKEKDFTISYGPAGKIDKIEIYGTIEKPVTPTAGKKPQTRPVQNPYSPIPSPFPSPPSQPSPKSPPMPSTYSPQPSPKSPPMPLPPITPIPR